MASAAEKAGPNRGRLRDAPITGGLFDRPGRTPTSISYESPAIRFPGR